MKPNMDISYFTSDNSHFDDYSDSTFANATCETVTENKLETALPKISTPTKDTFVKNPHFPTSPVTSVHLPRKDSIANVQNKPTDIQELEKIIQPTDIAHGNPQSIIQRNEMKNMNSEENSIETASPNSPKNATTNIKDADDDDLIEALYMCEQNFTNPQLFSRDNPPTSYSSATDSEESDKYSNVNLYLEVLQKKNGQKSNVNLIKSEYPFPLKDYSSDNPNANSFKSY